MESSKYPWPRIHTYRPQVKLITDLFFCLLLFIGSYLIFWPYIVSLEISHYHQIGLSYYTLLIVFCFILYEYRFGLLPLKYFSVRAYPDYLEIQDKYGIHKLVYDDVVDIKLFSYGVLGAKYTLKTKEGKRFDFTVLLERSEYILNAVCERRTNLLPKEKFDKFSARLIYFDHCAARYHDTFSWYWPVYFFQLIVFPVLTIFFVAYLQGKLDDLLLGHWSYAVEIFFNSILITCLFVWTLVYLLNEIIFLTEYKRRTTRDPDQTKRRSLSFERKMFWPKFIVSHSLILVILLILGVTQHHLIYQITLGHDFPVAKLKAKDEIQIDSRYNCLECDFSVQKHDIVYVKGHFVGLKRQRTLATVQSLPGEVFYMPKRDFLGRNLAGLERLIVPPGFIGIHLGPFAQRVIISQSDLLGKYVR